MTVVTELSPAKLNLALSVGPPDTGTGMHPICSWMVTVDFFDELEVRPLPAGSLSRYAIMWHTEARRRSDINWPIHKDLAVRAHLAIEKYLGRQLPLQLKLEKRIPVGGGLGGGSSNAAAMLRAVNELYNLNLEHSDLVQIAATLGSDVPFFITGGSAIVSGLGEQLATHETVPDLHAVIVLPDAHCATPAVYQLFDRIIGDRAALRTNDVATLSSNGRISNDALFNDLANAALAVAPSLKGNMKNVADLAERAVHITGSGSSMFVICDDSLHAGALAETIERQLNLPAVAVTMHQHSHERTTR